MLKGEFFMILIDGSHALYRTLIINKDAVKETPEFIAHLFISQILAFSTKLGGSKLNKVVLCMDSSSWRKQYYIDNRPKDYGIDTYKGQRVKDASIDWTSVFDYVNQVTDALKANSDFKVMRVKEAEADDIIAVLTKAYRDTETIWIASSDKDFVQLQDTPNVNIYDPLKQNFKPTVDKEYFKQIHIMIGDASDNIRAIKERLGEKTAIKILKELPILLQTSPSMREKYEFNKNLIDFDCIPCYINDRIIDEYNNLSGKFNAMELIKDFRTLKLVQHTENINKFKLSDSIVETKLNTYFKKLAKDIQTSKSSLEDFFS
jgi:hypothetical protein